MRKEFQTGSICLLLCLMSLMFCHNAGNYTFTIYDNFCGSIPLLVIALFECIGVAYFYGLQKFCEDIQLMTGRKLEFSKYIDILHFEMIKCPPFLFISTTTQGQDQGYIYVYAGSISLLPSWQPSLSLSLPRCSGVISHMRCLKW